MNAAKLDLPGWDEAGPDFAQLRGEELKTTLGELGARAGAAIAGAQKAIEERAAERGRLLAAFKTAGVKRQLQALPELDAHSKTLLRAEADAAAADKQREQTLKLLQTLVASALGGKG